MVEVSTLVSRVATPCGEYDAWEDYALSPVGTPDAETTTWLCPVCDRTIDGIVDDELLARIRAGVVECVHDEAV
jgi:hypothetical protein